MTCGIYYIVDTESGKTYVGSSHKIENRWYRHRSSLRTGTHHAKHLQHVFDKRGESNLDFVIVEICEVAQLLTLEDVHLQRFVCAGTELNSRKEAAAGGTRKGQKNSAEHNAKMSAAQKGKPRTQRKRAWTDEQRASVALAMVERHKAGGRKRSNQHIKANGMK